MPDVRISELPPAAPFTGSEQAALVQAGVTRRALILPPRVDGATGLATDNPTLAAGQHGTERDTGLFKIGDGTTAYNDLPYFTPAPSVLGAASFTGGSATTITTTGNTELTALAKTIEVGPVRPVAVHFFTLIQMFTAAASVIIKVWDGAVGGTEVARFQTGALAVNASASLGGSLSASPALSTGTHTMRVSGSLSTITGGPSGVVGITGLRTEVRYVEE